MATKKKTETSKKALKKETKKETKKGVKPEARPDEKPFVRMFGNVDSKFRFVHVAAKRAKSLLKGAKPKIKIKSKSPIRLAQVEVKEGLIDYRILPSPSEEAPEKEGRGFLGGDGVPAADHEPETDETSDTAELEEGAAAEEEPEETFEEELPDKFEEEKEES
ncbi:MAG TPA: DNA-directed RNA polymerase subunit omega [Acidobacteriota bacterium]